MPGFPLWGSPEVCRLVASRSKALIEFKAGLMMREGSKVYPDTRRGCVFIYKGEDSRIHFCWCQRNFKGDHQDMIVDPNDWDFFPYPVSTTTRVYVLKHNDSSRDKFYWLQEPNDYDDDEMLDLVNELIQSGPDPQHGDDGNSEKLEFINDFMKKISVIPGSAVYSLDPSTTAAGMIRNGAHPFYLWPNNEVPTDTSTGTATAEEGHPSGVDRQVMLIETDEKALATVLGKKRSSRLLAAMAEARDIETEERRNRWCWWLGEVDDEDNYVIPPPPVFTWSKTNIDIFMSGMAILRGIDPEDIEVLTGTQRKYKFRPDTWSSEQSHALLKKFVLNYQKTKARLSHDRPRAGEKRRTPRASVVPPAAATTAMDGRRDQARRRVSKDLERSKLEEQQRKISELMMRELEEASAECERRHARLRSGRNGGDEEKEGSSGDADNSHGPTIDTLMSSLSLTADSGQGGRGQGTRRSQGSVVPPDAAGTAKGRLDGRRDQARTDVQKPKQKLSRIRQRVLDQRKKNQILADQRAMAEEDKRRRVRRVVGNGGSGGQEGTSGVHGPSSSTASVPGVSGLGTRRPQVSVVPPARIVAAAKGGHHGRDQTLNNIRRPQEERERMRDYGNQHSVRTRIAYERFKVAEKWLNQKGAAKEAGDQEYYGTGDHSDSSDYEDDATH